MRSVWSRERTGSSIAVGAPGVEAAQKERAFHLGTGDGHGVLDALQGLALDQGRDGDRWVELVGLGACGACDMGAPGPQRLDDAAHRAAGERFVADHARAETLAAQEAGEQPHRRARVAAVDHVTGHSKPVKADPIDRGGLVRALDRDAHRAKRLACRRVVQAFGQAGDAGAAAAQRAEDEAAMADRFVARHLARCREAAPNAGRGNAFGLRSTRD